MHYIWISMHALQLNYVNYSWTSMHYSWSRNISDELPCTAAELASTTAKLACLLQLAYLLHTLQQTFHILCTADLTYTIAELACISADVNIMLSALTYVCIQYIVHRYQVLWFVNVQTDAELYTDYNMVVVTGGRHDRQILLTRRESCTHPSSRHAHTSLVVLFHLTMFPCSQLSRRGGGRALCIQR